jgi:hypothetical protein
MPSPPRQQANLLARQGPVENAQFIDSTFQECLDTGKVLAALPEPVAFAADETQVGCDGERLRLQQHL